MPQSLTVRTRQRKQINAVVFLVRKIGIEAPFTASTTENSDAAIVDRLFDLPFNASLHHGLLRSGSRIPMMRLSGGVGAVMSLS